LHKAFFYSLIALLVALATYGSAFPERGGEDEREGEGECHIFCERDR
jgi:hypothetical protein